MTGEQKPLFEVIDSEEFQKAHAQSDKPKGTRTKRQPKTEPRKLVTWWGLTTELAECTVPKHEEVQENLTPEGKEYRRRYGRIRMVASINNLLVCRDCFIAGADKHGE